jgi:hypothetical protein
MAQGNTCPAIYMETAGAWRVPICGPAAHAMCVWLRKPLLLWYHLTICDIILFGVPIYLFTSKATA